MHQMRQAAVLAEAMTEVRMIIRGASAVSAVAVADVWRMWQWA